MEAYKNVTYLEACVPFFSFFEPREFVDNVESCRVSATAFAIAYLSFDCQEGKDKKHGISNIIIMINNINNDKIH